MPGYAAALAALGDQQLVDVLSRRADLRTGQAPTSFAELASRAGAQGSIQAALALLDAGTLQLAELLAVLGLPTTVQALTAAAGPELSTDQIKCRLGHLADLGLALTAPDGTISGPRGLSAAFTRPGSLGPSVAELAKIGVNREHLAAVATHLGIPADGDKHDLIRTVSAALADPTAVRRLADAADPTAAALLDRARTGDGQVTVTGTGGGRYANHPDAAAATWLLERGLLLPATYERLVVPRETEIALRGGWVFPHWPDPPRLPDPRPLPPPGDGATAAAHRLVLAAEGCTARLDRAPIPLIKTGTVSVRDLRRLAHELDLDEDEGAFLLDLLVAAGVLAPGGPWDRRSVGLTSAADSWLAGTRADRWVHLVTTWRDQQTAFEEHFLLRHGIAPAAEETPRPLLVRQVHGVAARRECLLETLATIPARHGVNPAAVGKVLRWQRPRRWKAPSGTHPHTPGGASGPVSAVLTAAALLGLAAVSGQGLQDPAALCGPGLGTQAWLDRDDRALAAAAADALGDGTREFLIAGDLTVVAPGGLAPDVDIRLSAMADRVSTGGAATWRIEEPTLRRALDAGETGDTILAFLRDHSQTPLPAALDYLVTDTQRRHGRLRVGAASTYLRGDTALVAELARSPAGRRLDLREVAPGVLVTAASQRDVMAALRKAGESPVAESPDGTTSTEVNPPVRHTLRPAATHEPGRATAPALADPDRLVTRLRAAPAPPRDDLPRPAAAPGHNGSHRPHPVGEARRG